MIRKGKDRLLLYFDEIKNKCDYMANHKINVILMELTVNR